MKLIKQACVVIIIPLCFTVCNCLFHNFNDKIFWWHMQWCNNDNCVNKLCHFWLCEINKITGKLLNQENRGKVDSILGKKMWSRSFIFHWNNRPLGWDFSVPIDWPNTVDAFYWILSYILGTLSLHCEGFSHSWQWWKQIVSKGNTIFQASVLRFLPLKNFMWIFFSFDESVSKLTDSFRLKFKPHCIISILTDKKHTKQELKQQCTYNVWPSLKKCLLSPNS